MDVVRTEEHLTELEVEARYKIPVRTLQTWRHQRRVLPFIKVGRLVRYRVVDLERHALKNLVQVDV